MEPDKTDESGKGHPRVAAVVLNWNGGAMNRTCLDALLNCGYPNLGVIFVDNGSTDGSGEEVKNTYPHIHHIFVGENLGFTGGNNKGIEKAIDLEAEMVLILNNDVEVPQGFLDPLVADLEGSPGITGPKVLDPGGRVWCAGGMLSFHQNLTSLRGFGRMDNGRFERKEPVDYIPACCILISREVFDSVGFFSDAYFCYLEDVDFCFRARKAGYRVTYCPDSRVVHSYSHSTGGGYTPARKYMNAVNSLRFLKNHGTLKAWISFWLLDVATLPAVLVYRLFTGETKGALAKARGIWEGLMGGKVSRKTLDRYIPRKEDKN